MKRITLSIFAIALFTLLTTNLSAQDQTTPPPHPCAAPEFRQFDFWVGEWEIAGRYRASDTSWGEGTATNTVTIDYDSCVIIENFHSEDFALNGHSVSTYGRLVKKWRQTWVDNSGSYFEFIGGLDSTGRMILYNEKEIKGKTVKHRMVFQNIEKDSLFWTWEKLLDDGITWQSNFELRYKRKQ